MTLQKKLEHNFSINFKRFLERSLLIKYDETLDSLFDLSNKLFFLPTEPDSFEQFFVKSQAFFEDTANTYQKQLESKDLIDVEEDNVNFMKEFKNDAKEMDKTQNNPNIVFQDISSNTFSSMTHTNESSNQSQKNTSSQGKITSFAAIENVKTPPEEEMSKNLLISLANMQTENDNKRIFGSLMSSELKDVDSSLTKKKSKISFLLTDKPRSNFFKDPLNDLIDNLKSFKEISKQTEKNLSENEGIRQDSSQKDFRSLSRQFSNDNNLSLKLSNSFNNKRKLKSKTQIDPQLTTPIDSQNSIHSLDNQNISKKSEKIYRQKIKSKTQVLNTNLETNISTENNQITPDNITVNSKPENIKRDVSKLSLILEVINEDIIEEKDSTFQNIEDFQEHIDVYITQHNSEATGSEKNQIAVVEHIQNNDYIPISLKEFITSQNKISNSNNFEIIKNLLTNIIDEMIDEINRPKKIENKKSKSISNEENKEFSGKIQFPVANMQKIDKNYFIVQKNLETNNTSEAIKPTSIPKIISFKEVEHTHHENLIKDLPNFVSYISLQNENKSVDKEDKIKIDASFHLRSLPTLNSNTNQMTNLNERNNIDNKNQIISEENPRIEEYNKISDIDKQHIHSQIQDKNKIIQYIPTLIVEKKESPTPNQKSKTNIKNENNIQTDFKIDNEVNKPIANDPFSEKILSNEIIKPLNQSEIAKPYSSKYLLYSFENQNNEKTNNQEYCHNELVLSRLRKSNSAVCFDQTVNQCKQSTSHSISLLNSLDLNNINVRRLTKYHKPALTIIDFNPDTIPNDSQVVPHKILSEPIITINGTLPVLAYNEKSNQKNMDNSPMSIISTMFVPANNISPNGHMNKNIKITAFQEKNSLKHTIDKMPNNVNANQTKNLESSPNEKSEGGNNMNAVSITGKRMSHITTFDKIIHPSSGNHIYDQANPSNYRNHRFASVQINQNQALQALANIINYQSLVFVPKKQNNCIFFKGKNYNMHVQALPNRSSKGMHYFPLVTPEDISSSVTIKSRLETNQVDFQIMANQNKQTPQFTNKSSISSSIKRKTFDNIQKILFPESKEPSELQHKDIDANTYQEYLDNGSIVKGDPDERFKTPRSVSRKSKMHQNKNQMTVSAVNPYSNKDQKQQEVLSDNYVSKFLSVKKLSDCKNNKSINDSPSDTSHLNSKQTDHSPNKLELQQSQLSANVHVSNQSLEGMISVRTQQTNQEASNSISNNINESKDEAMTKTVKKMSKPINSNSKKSSNLPDKIRMDMQKSQPINYRLTNITKDRKGTPKNIQLGPRTSQKELMNDIKQQNENFKQKNLQNARKSVPKVVQNVKNYKLITNKEPIIPTNTRPSSSLLPSIVQEQIKEAKLAVQDNDKINFNINITLVIQNQAPNPPIISPLIADKHPQIKLIPSKIDSSVSNRNLKPSKVVVPKKGIIINKPANIQGTKTDFWKKKIYKPEIPKLVAKSFNADDDKGQSSFDQKNINCVKPKIETPCQTQDSFFKPGKIKNKRLYPFNNDFKENMNKSRVTVLPKITTSEAPSNDKSLYIEQNIPTREINHNDSKFIDRPCQSVGKASEYNKSSKLKLKNELDQWKLSKPSQVNSPYDLQHSNQILRKNFNVEIKILDSPEPRISSNIYNFKYQVCKSNLFLHHNNNHN